MDIFLGQPSKRGVSGTRQQRDATHWLVSKNQSYYHSVAVIRLENTKHPTQGTTRHCQSSRSNWSLCIKCNRSKISYQTLPLKKEDVPFGKLHNVLLVSHANRYTATRAVGNIYTRFTAVYYNKYVSSRRRTKSTPPSWIGYKFTTNNRRHIR